jgi:hypothetical protein
VPEAVIGRPIPRRALSGCRSAVFDELLVGNDHGVAGYQRFDSQIAEAGFLHPSDAVRRREVEPTGRHDQHIEARQQTRGSGTPLIVDESFVNDERTVRWQRGLSLLQQHLLCWKIPIVQNAAHDDDLGGRQWVSKKIPRIELQPVR